MQTGRGPTPCIVQEYSRRNDTKFGKNLTKYTVPFCRFRVQSTLHIRTVSGVLLYKIEHVLNVYTKE